MNIVRLNTAALNQVHLNHIGERTQGGGSGDGTPSTPSYENGVYIQHINRKLYTTSEWGSGAFSNDEANGVAVVTNNAKFVIAKVNVGTYMVWSSNTSSLVDGIFTSTSADEAKNDFAGYANTQLMLATDTSGAGFSCANFTFPNGDKGYLPALGELNEAYLNKSAIDSAMTLIGGTKMSGYFWSSTQNFASASWTLFWRNGDTLGDYKSTGNYVRAFATLNF